MSYIILGVLTEEPVATCTVINLQNANKFLYSTCRGTWNNKQCDLNATVAYQCGDEYNLLGPSVTTCVANNTWFPQPGRCVHKSGFDLFCSVLLNCSTGKLRIY